jgi:hypothetical protein
MVGPIIILNHLVVFFCIQASITSKLQLCLSVCLFAATGSKNVKRAFVSFLPLVAANLTVASEIQEPLPLLQGHHLSEYSFVLLAQLLFAHMRKKLFK